MIRTLDIVVEKNLHLKDTIEEEAVGWLRSIPTVQDIKKPLPLEDRGLERPETSLGLPEEIIEVADLSGKFERATTNLYQQLVPLLFKKYLGRTGDRSFIGIDQAFGELYLRITALAEGYGYGPTPIRKDLWRRVNLYWFARYMERLALELQHIQNQKYNKMFLPGTGNSQDSRALLARELQIEVLYLDKDAELELEIPGNELVYARKREDLWAEKIDSSLSPSDHAVLIVPEMYLKKSKRHQIRLQPEREHYGKIRDRLGEYGIELPKRWYLEVQLPAPKRSFFDFIMRR